MSKTVLAIDVGSYSVKAMVIDKHGTPIAKAQIFLGPYISKQPGWSELDPDHFWKALCNACQTLWETSADLRDQIQCVAITTQRATVINVDANGQPLRPAITWMDNRRVEGLPPIGGLWGLLFKFMGLSEAIAKFQANAEANWIKTFEPGVWQATHKFLLLSGYLNFKLCGKFLDSAASQVGYIPFDFKRQTWASSRDWKWRVSSLTKDLLPDLVECGQVLGTISSPAALATGLPHGLPIIAAAADKACEVLGSGCIDPTIAHLSLGTAATVNISNDKYVELYHYLPPYPAAFPKGYNNEYQLFKGFWMVEWFIREFGLHEQKDYPLDKQLEDLASHRIPGNGGLILQPFWAPGLKVSESHARGAIIGFKDYHQKEHLYQAILEGIAYGLKEGMENIQAYTKTHAKSLRVSGGGSQSIAIMQIIADVFGLPASRLHLYETSCLGAAINAAVACGLHPNYPAAVKAMTRLRDTFEPNPKAHEIYQRLFERVYKKMLKQLTPLYNEIDKLERRVSRS